MHRSPSIDGLTVKLRAPEGQSGAERATSWVHTEEVLACASFMPRAVLEAPKLTSELLVCAQPLVRELAQLYRVPTPELELFKSRPGVSKSAWYSPRSHVVTITSDCRPQDLLGLIFHEFNHIGQFKAITAAVLADPQVREAYRKSGQEFFPAMVEAVKEQQLDQMPLYVSIGRSFAASHLQVWQAQRIEAQTMDIDEYLEMRAVYRKSLLELTATISELDANLWLKERLREDCCAKLGELKEKRCEIPAWALCTGFQTLFSSWVEERRNLKLLREIDALSEELDRKMEEVVERFSARESEVQIFNYDRRLPPIC
jgi:hypothetical protein